MSDANVANIIVIPFAARSALGDAVEFESQRRQGNIVGLKVRADESDDSATVVFDVQDSEDGTGYTDVSGAGGSVVARGILGRSFTTAKFFKIRTSGGAGRLELTVEGNALHVVAP